MTARGVVRPADEAGGDALAPLVAAIERIPPQEGIFFYPYDPMLPYLTLTRHVVGWDVFTPGYTTRAQYVAACGQMLEHARWVVLDREWADPHLIKALFPALTNPSPPEKLMLESAMIAGYAPADDVGERFVILHRKTRALKSCATFDR